jgi:hypothetical protein
VTGGGCGGAPASPPPRHLDQALGDQRWVVVGPVVVPEAQCARRLDADRLGAHDFVQRIGHAIGLFGIQPDPRPQLRPAAQVGQRLGLESGVDRQQGQQRRQAGFEAQLDRAHRGAARRGGQDAAAGVGEEDGVDQLRLAARKLGHEGHAQPIGREPLAQGTEAAFAGLVLQVMIDQVARQFSRLAIEAAAPVG